MKSIKVSSEAMHLAARANEAEEATEKPLCFVISQIGAENSPQREFANGVLKHVIKKALGSKYKIERADEIGKPGLITVQVIQRLSTAELVVADLSGANANVYYELALRHYFAMPVVHIIQRGERAPFDVSPMRYVEFELKDPDSLDTAHEDIQKQVEAMEKGEKVVTLVQVAGVFAEASLGKGDETLGVVKAMYGELGNLRQSVENVSAQVSSMQSGRLYGTAPHLGRADLFSGRRPLAELMGPNFPPEYELGLLRRQVDALLARAAEFKKVREASRSAEESERGREVDREQAAESEEEGEKRPGE